MGDYTRTDLTDCITAINEFKANRRVGRVTIGTKTIVYAETTLDALLKLKAEIKLDLGDVPLRTYGKNGGRCAG